MEKFDPKVDYPYSVLIPVGLSIDGKYMYI
jgi:hypothetical protein